MFVGGPLYTWVCVWGGGGGAYIRGGLYSEFYGICLKRFERRTFVREKQKDPSSHSVWVNKKLTTLLCSWSPRNKQRFVPLIMINCFEKCLFDHTTLYSGVAALEIILWAFRKDPEKNNFISDSVFLFIKIYILFRLVLHTFKRPHLIYHSGCMNDSAIVRFLARCSFPRVGSL